MEIMIMKGRDEYKIKSNQKELLIKDIGEPCCDNPSLTIKSGEQVCINCGMIKGRDFVDTEKRAYTKKEIEKRKRTEIRWRRFGPRTIISNTRRDSMGHKMGPKGKNLFSRLSKIQNSLISSIERNFWEAKPKLNLLASKLSIPDYIKETAWKIYILVVQKKLTMGRSINGFIAASLYSAIRIHEFPRLLDEICDAFMTPGHIVHQSLGILVRDILPELNLKYHPIKPEQLIFRFGNDLGLSMEVQKKALWVLQQSTKNGLNRVGKDPRGFAAAVIYLAAKPTNERLTQSEVSEVSNITEVTLRTRNKEIKKHLFEN
jgi:transcription initiation factor TFIIB